MKIKVNDELILELTETQKKVIQNDIHSDEFDEDIKRRLKWVLDQKYKRCFTRLQDEWIPKFKADKVASIPLDDDAFAQLVFSHKDYKNRKQKDDLLKDKKPN